jgi:hypothetical protein
MDDGKALPGGACEVEQGEQGPIVAGRFAFRWATRKTMRPTGSLRQAVIAISYTRWMLTK